MTSMLTDKSEYKEDIKMKKYIMLAFLLLFTSMLLVACGTKENADKAQTENTSGTEETAQNSEGTEKEDKWDEKKKEDNKADKNENTDQLLDEITKVNKELKSFSFETETDSLQTYGDRENHFVHTQKQDIIFDPLQVKVTMKSEQAKDSDEDLGGFGEEESTIYIVDGKTYSQHAFSGEEWNTSENSFTDDQIIEQETLDIRNIIDRLKDYTDEQKFEENEDNYVIHILINPDKITESDIKSMEESNLAQDENAQKKMLETYKIEETSYKMTIDKKTKYLKTLELSKKYSYDMDFDGEEGTMLTEEKSITTYTNHNNVDEIALPDDVK